MAKRARDFAPNAMRKRMKTVARWRKTRRTRARTNYVTGTKGTAVTSMFKNKRMSYKSYKNAVYKSLMFKESYRSVLSTASTAGFTLTGLDKKLWLSQALTTQFYTTGGGLINSTDTFSTSKFIIKGGVLSVALVNSDASPIIVEWMPVRYLDDEYTINGTETEYLYDVSCFPGFGKSFKLVGKPKRVVVEAGDRIEMRMKIPFTIINNIDEWTNSEKGKMAIVYTIQANSVAAESFPRVVSHNLTFVADAIA